MSYWDTLLSGLSRTHLWLWLGSIALGLVCYYCPEHILYCNIIGLIINILMIPFACMFAALLIYIEDNRM
jgi:hypothetical protein